MKALPIGGAFFCCAAGTARLAALLLFVMIAQFNELSHFANDTVDYPVFIIDTSAPKAGIVAF